MKEITCWVFVVCLSERTPKLPICLNTFILTFLVLEVTHTCTLMCTCMHSLQQSWQVPPSHLALWTSISSTVYLIALILSDLPSCPPDQSSPNLLISPSFSFESWTGDAITIFNTLIISLPLAE